MLPLKGNDPSENLGMGAKFLMLLSFELTAQTSFRKETQA